MAKSRTDQAEGLRRLLARSGLRVVSISAGTGGGGRIGAIVNLAGALAELGSDVLILDEYPPAQGVAAALGLKARCDLQDVISGKRDIDDMIVRGPGGILVLPLARGADSLSRLPASVQERLMERCGRLGLPVDTLLMNAAPGGGSTPIWPLTGARDVVVLAGSGSAAITTAYASIKRLCTEFERREFLVLVSNVAIEGEAREIFGNMAGVARRYLQVSLEFMGHIPPDDKLRHAARLRLPVVAAFPAAAAAGNFRRLARAIAGWPLAEECDGGFDDFMRRLINSSRLRTAATETSL